MLEARKTVGFTQLQLAQLLGTSQATVARWEKGTDSPPGPAFAAIADLVTEDQRPFWLDLAGLPVPERQTPTHAREVPLLKDPAAAGTPRVLDENEIEAVIPFPRDWLPRGGKLYAVRVAGDSMSPILNDGYVVLIDTTQRDPKKLVEKMVAAREGDGVTIKWLRHADGVYMLQPQHSSARHQVRVMKSESDHSIVGAVVMWIGQPVPVKR